MAKLWCLKGIFRQRLLNPKALNEVAMSRTWQVTGWKFTIDGRFDFVLKHSAIQRLNSLRVARSHCVDVRISPNIIIRMPPLTNRDKDYELCVLLDSVCVSCTICSLSAANHPRLVYDGKVLQIAFRAKLDQDVAYFVGYGWRGRGIYYSGNECISIYLLIALFIADAIWQFDGHPYSGAS